MLCSSGLSSHKKTFILWKHWPQPLLCGGMGMEVIVPITSGGP